MKAALLSRIKVLAQLDIAQQRLPQDGRIKARSRDGALDLRVSTLPTQYGEKIVLRLLGSSRAPSLLDLGFSLEQLTAVDAMIHQPQGLVLVTGPTGAGKSTTLYSMLTRRQAPDINIVTVEDPIERRLPGITQSQVGDKSGATFARYLRAILRQDPDVIMIGEIRDGESAEIAFQAALTGHLVLTTLHANGTIEAVDRLLDIGVKPLMITSVTNLVLAQRLARLICAHCRERYQPAAAAVHDIGLDDLAEFTRGRGCDQCGHTGYRGRLGIFEVLRLTPALKELIRRRASEAELHAAAHADGTRWLRDDAAAKIRAGLTTVEEVLRVVRVDDQDSAAPARVSAPCLLPPPGGTVVS
jgi:type II secretory ATPase GspE/PulE/Tfp pilus assembly ATPase PilB-like protein